ncbi:MAG: hypothetical protein CL944_02960 [Candidatus Diapherotrites archaeon]|uniref:Uncharacterized protein n=1 Tax=Candidatus Iainarchaeum sp. TaxID=3101447 RepID=A0A2D6LQM8_9ARCH|nr:hypothetical protein [Candidatus Diapherotrites archaeon]|tara:strand:+ start:377 stop:1327 length:951 start_codon:yes stop_codon:yes gene_type:complete
MHAKRNVRTRGKGYFAREKTALAQVRRQQFIARTGELILAQTGRKRISIGFLESLPRTRKEIEAELRNRSKTKVTETKRQIVTEKHGEELLEILTIVRKANLAAISRAEKALEIPPKRRTQQKQRAINAKLKSNPKIKDMCSKLLEIIKNEPDYPSEKIRRNDMGLLELLIKGISANRFIGSEEATKKAINTRLEKAKGSQEKNIQIKRADAYKRTLETLGNRQQLTPRDLARLYTDLLESGQIASERKAGVTDTGNRIAKTEIEFRRTTSEFIDWKNESSWTSRDFKKVALKAELRGFTLPPSIAKHLPPRKNKK